MVVQLSNKNIGSKVIILVEALSVRPSVRPSVRLSVRPYVRTSVRPSVCPYRMSQKVGKRAF